MHIPVVLAPFAYTSTRWRWISAGQMFFAFTNLITEPTPQLSGLVIGMAHYKALGHSNQFTQWI
jgi:hypothetical protein